jgi:hypothetical protein
MTSGDERPGVIPGTRALPEHYGPTRAVRPSHDSWNPLRLDRSKIQDHLTDVVERMTNTGYILRSKCETGPELGCQCANISRWNAREARVMGHRVILVRTRHSPIDRQGIKGLSLMALILPRITSYPAAQEVSFGYRVDLVDPDESYSCRGRIRLSPYTQSITNRNSRTAVLLLSNSSFSRARI